MTEQPWIYVAEELPREGILVETKIEDERGIRNIQCLIYRSGLWWTRNMSTYVYYRPTHWRKKQ